MLDTDKSFNLQVETPEPHEILIKGNSYFEEGSILLEILYYFDPINELGTRDLFELAKFNRELKKQQLQKNISDVEMCDNCLYK